MRVVIVENQGFYLDLLTDALRGRGIDVAGRAADLAEALRVIDETVPDLVVLDIRLTDATDDEGLRVAELVRAQYPDVALLALSAYLEPAYAERLLVMETVPRAVGYLGKERLGNLDELVQQDPAGTPAVQGREECGPPRSGTRTADSPRRRIGVYHPQAG